MVQTLTHRNINFVTYQFTFNVSHVAAMTLISCICIEHRYVNAHARCVSHMIAQQQDAVTSPVGLDGVSLVDEEDAATCAAHV